MPSWITFLGPYGQPLYQTTENQGFTPFHKILLKNVNNRSGRPYRQTGLDRFVKNFRRRKVPWEIKTCEYVLLWYRAVFFSQCFPTPP